MAEQKIDTSEFKSEATPVTDKIEANIVAYMKENGEKPGWMDMSKAKFDAFCKEQNCTTLATYKGIGVRITPEEPVEAQSSVSV